ncbi:hypothetical protein B0H10DRAFT_2217294 [Mycena sp. CBHHK59/15]|nr:hypothetical protein B0H10DRAFT_2217294 [Mycena sp. CBHHK59/15]
MPALASTPTSHPVCVAPMPHPCPACTLLVLAPTSSLPRPDAHTRPQRPSPAQRLRARPICAVPTPRRPADANRPCPVPALAPMPTPICSHVHACLQHPCPARCLCPPSPRHMHPVCSLMPPAPALAPTPALPAPAPPAPAPPAPALAHALPSPVPAPAPMPAHCLHSAHAPPTGCTQTL